MNKGVRVRGGLREMQSETESAVLSVSECAKILKISRGSAYRGIIENSIPHIKIGRRILVPKLALQKMLEGNSKPGKTGSVLDHERL